MSKKISQKAGTAWVRPLLVKLGKLEDVAGSLTLNNNGVNVNVKS